MPLPAITVVSAGAMGAAVAARLVKAGCTVFTNLDGRSEATRQRARNAGMKDIPFDELHSKSDWVLSILPPSEAHAFAEKFVKSTSVTVNGAHGLGASANGTGGRRLVFADCNAVNPQTVKRISALFDNTAIKFIDAGIIGGPPTDSYKPTFYASAEPADESTLDDFVALSDYGLKVTPLKGDGAGVGDASALKMSYAGITKGFIGLCTTMVLAANAASPATAQALIQELKASQPFILQRIINSTPNMIPKAYRWVGEMEEIAAFVGENEGDVYHGMAKLYERVEKALKEGGGDIDVLNDFVEDAKQSLEKK